MAIEHRNIPESGQHEPKGATTAAANRVYISDGAGSGAWSYVDADALQGTINNTIPSGRRIVTDGTGGFTATLTPGSTFGTMNLTNNATTVAVPAATDPTLNTNTDFVETALAYTFDDLQEITNGSNYLEIENPGRYAVHFWANVASDTASTRWSLKFVVNGVDFVPRGPKLWLNSANEYYNVSANGIHDFVAGDQIKLYIAANKAVNITIEDLTFQLLYLGEEI